MEPEDQAQKQKRAVIRTKYEEMLGDAVIARRLERSTWNRVVQEARRDGLCRKWQNPVFRKRYVTKGLHIMFNVKNPATPGLKARCSRPARS